jgi:hypothetical protein
MQRFIILALTVITLLGCRRENPGKDIIPPETLVPILVDFHLVYSIQAMPSFRNLNQKVDSLDIYSYVFEKYGVTKPMFDSTIAWYSRNPEPFTEIYDEVVMQLTQLRDSLESDRE